MNDIIVAPATAPGGALGVVRLSGAGCADTVLRFLRKPAAAGTPELPERRAVLAEAVDGAEVLDQVLAVRFAPGRSYTGEEMVELSAHGSSFVMDRLAALACLHGARPARPGEFTQRAFLNGRMDLVQAEAVCDLIA
ncbi:MAG: tRNA uridine-5-carboxymethylaminomethyl(34) synthesis GTPase MnmE, partial [Elusimicrobiota bacterium]